MNSPELLGYCASIASGGAYFPQAVRALRTRQTRVLSLPSVSLAAWATKRAPCSTLYRGTRVTPVSSGMGAEPTR
jgi:hypothetical protein